MAASPNSLGDDHRRRRSSSRSRSRDRGDDDHKRSKSSRRRRKRSDDEEDSDGDDSSRDRHRDRKHKRGSRKRSKSSKHHRSSDRDRKRSKKKKRRRDYSSSSDDSSSDSSSDSDSSSSSSSSRRRSKRRKKTRKKSSKKSSADKQPTKHNTMQMNEKLISKLSQRNETLEEREERRAKRRAARITARFGYTADDNPFRDPNLHEMFTWKKKEEQQQTTGEEKNGGGEDETNKEKNYYGSNVDEDNNNSGGKNPKSRRDKQEQIFSEIEKVRNRRRDRELHLEEMERIRAEESKMKELEHYDEWARKEEAFHLQQQRQRSAIRLVEGREKAVDVLAQNILLFGARNEDEENAARVKYKEKYSALEELETLEVNLQEPHSLLKDLKLSELEELLVDIDAFRRLEREAASEGGNGEDNMAIHYWDALHKVTLDEIQYLKSGGEKGNHASMVNDIRGMFKGQSMAALVQMKQDIEQKLRGGVLGDSNGVVDTDYWQKVLHQLDIHLAKMELSEIHSKMLVKQLEKLDVKREELRKKAEAGETVEDTKPSPKKLSSAEMAAPLPEGVDAGFGNLEEELGLDDEIDLNDGKPNSQYAMQDKFRPRKPRYFNRVKTGYDWNAYNKTHYDHDNPPPKIVQGYKFNVFYPDLIDRTKTPQYFLEKADTDDFCILRFSAGPPYEDVAFKIINRQWNKSRKRGFRCTFERGVLSLYFNFATHWYRR